MTPDKTIINSDSRKFVNIVKEAFSDLGRTLVAFTKAPKALWGINIPYVIEGLVYFGILTILGKYCSENVGLSDLHAGWVYSAVTGGITFAMLMLGGVSDKIGVRQSLALALSVMMVGRFMISLSGTLPLGEGIGSPMFLLMSAGLLLMVAAYGLYQPAAYAGVKRYTTPKTAAMGYAVVYALMNLGAFFSGFISPTTRHLFEDVFPPNGLTAVFWVYTFLTMCAVITTLFILTKRTDQAAVDRIEKEAEESKVEQQTKKPANDQPTPKEKIDNRLLLLLGIGILLTFIVLISQLVKNQSSYKISLITIVVLVLAAIWEFLRKRPDYPLRDMRFLFFIFILIPVQTLFAHVWLTVPYYLDRTFAGTVVGNYFEFFSNLNPILIFILAPLIAALTPRTKVYRMMILGTFVMATPTFLLSFGPNTILFLVYVLFMTIGEAMWQPRFLQWIAEIAPEGKTGAYMGIGQMPWFLTKVITGLYSGYFVENYIPLPDSGLPFRTGEMWFIYAVIAMISPIALLLAKKWMMKGMKEKAA